MRIWSNAEIEKSTKNGNILIISKYKVYDITSFIDYHPGGEYALKRNINRDCSCDYDYHSYNGKKKWKKYCVGRLERTGISRFIFGK